MRAIKARECEQIELRIKQGDEESSSATVLIDYDGVTLSFTEPYIDGYADIQIPPNTFVPGSYEYQVNENFDYGPPDIYPDASCCKLPKLKICYCIPE